MKMRINKIKYLLILFIMPFIFSCAEVVSNPILLSELPKVATNTWIMSSMDSINAYKLNNPNNRIVLNMAKGEAEHFQLVLETPNKGNLAVKQFNLNNNISLEVREIKSFESKDDILVPFKDSISANSKVVKLWITFETRTDASVGEYQEVLKFSGSAGDILVGVTINIYNCTIPPTPSIPSLFGIVANNITPDITGELLIAKRKEYSDILLSKRATPYFSTWLSGTMKVENFSSPFAWDDTRTMDYFADKRFTHLVLPSHNLTDIELGTLTQQINSKRWDKKQVFYIWDEPTKMTEYDQIKKMSERIHNLNNKAQVITTFYRGPEDGPRINDLFAVWDYLRDYTSLFCTGVWSLQNSESRSAQCKAKCVAGEEWWTYVCMGDRPGLAFSSTPIENRAVLWRSYKEQSTGFLYWAVNAFSSLNPLRPRKELPAGDGLLIFPGAPFGAESPVVSMRLERWRDGAEDYELLLQMEKKIGRTATEQLLGTVYKNSTSISIKPEFVDNFHTKLLENVSK